MLKKAGIVTVGVTAALLAAAPIASAGESPDNDSKSKSKDNDNDNGKKKKHHNNKGDQNGTGNIKCNAEGGDFDSSSEGAVAVSAPILSGNTGQALSCNSFLNDFLNDNEVNIAS